VVPNPPRLWSSLLGIPIGCPSGPQQSKSSDSSTYCSCLSSRRCCMVFPTCSVAIGSASRPARRHLRHRLLVVLVCPEAHPAADSSSQGMHNASVGSAVMAQPGHAAVRRSCCCSTVLVRSVFLLISLLLATMASAGQSLHRGYHKVGPASVSHGLHNVGPAVVST